MEKLAVSFRMNLDTQYYFTISAFNGPNAYGVGCEVANSAALIYGVIQKDPSVCCTDTSSYFDPSTC